MKKSPLVVIVGETASGKSALAMELARQFNGEIIAADSWTVYKGFDIGTAKPTSAEQVQIPHHLLDVADPRKGFSAPQFKRLALRAIEDVAKRGKLPILVGGTGLYVDSVIYDYQFLPPTSPDQRQELNMMTLPDLHHQAEVLGLDTTGIDMRNKRRVIRLIETNGARPTKQPLRANTLVLGVGWEREQLRERVEARLERMFEQGLVDEVKQLADMYGWEVEPMKGICYREFYDYFNGTQSLERTKERIISTTMGLAKRQRTWFKRNADIQYPCNFEEAVELTTTFLNNS
jgi:tRNA dimethylallyltransferase